MSVGSAIPQNEPDPGASPADAVHETPLCGMIAIDVDRRIVAIDTDVELLLGTRPRELIGRPLRDLPTQLGERFARVLDGAAPMSEDLVELVANDGSPFTVSLNVRALGNGVSQIAVASLLDVTAIREREANTLRLERLASIGTLSASMAHEIKNALVAVRTFAELLVRKNQDAELASLASRELTRIDSIVSQMLRFGGLGKPTFVPLGLNEVIAHACRLLQHQLGEQRVALALTLNAEPDRVHGDSYQLHQVLLNLLFNALDAMPGGGELEVATEFVPLPPSANSSSTDMHSCVRLTVRDTGAGIPAENLAKMFEPFFTTKTKGTGLGLSITRRIVKEHGATISVESEPGRGTTFTLLFPAVNAADEPLRV